MAALTIAALLLSNTELSVSATLTAAPPSVKVAAQLLLVVSAVVTVVVVVLVLVTTTSSIAMSSFPAPDGPLA